MLKLHLTYNNTNISGDTDEPPLISSAIIYSVLPLSSLVANITGGIGFGALQASLPGTLLDPTLT